MENKIKGEGGIKAEGASLPPSCFLPQRMQVFSFPGSKLPRQNQKMLISAGGADRSGARAEEPWAGTMAPVGDTRKPCFTQTLPAHRNSREKCSSAGRFLLWVKQGERFKAPTRGFAGPAHPMHPSLVPCMDKVPGKSHFHPPPPFLGQLAAEQCCSARVGLKKNNK